MGPILALDIRVYVDLLGNAPSLFQEQRAGIPGKDPERIEQKQKHDDNLGNHRFCDVSDIAVEHELRAFHMRKEWECAADDVRVEKNAEYREYQGDCPSHYYLSMPAPCHPLA